MSFVPGQFVVCVDDSPWSDVADPVFANPPCNGSVYVVDQAGYGWGEHIISLMEYPSPRPKFPCWWFASSFRPLAESRLDQFRVHLAPTPKTTVPA